MSLRLIDDLVARGYQAHLTTGEGVEGGRRAFNVVGVVASAWCGGTGSGGGPVGAHVSSSSSSPLVRVQATGIKPLIKLYMVML